MKRALLVALQLALSTTLIAADSPRLTILKAGPVGEVASLAEANEIRVVFSEPMVVVGRIPKPLVVPWFHSSPAIAGTFRWSGTTTLIFTPDSKTPLPYATRYTVNIDPAARALSGRTLDRPYSFSFTTPTIQLRKTNWYRKEGRFDAPVVIGLWFNQPVDAATLAPHLQLRTVKHEFKPPSLPALERLKASDASGVAAFEAKVAQAQRAADDDGTPVLSFVASRWDQKRFPNAPELIVLETRPGIAPETHLQVYVDDQLARSDKNVRTGRVQTFTIELEPALFVDGIDCVTACNAETSNRVSFRGRRGGVEYAKLRQALHVVDITDPAHEVVVQPAADREQPEWSSHMRFYDLDSLGYSLLPAHTYSLRIDPSLTAEDGQTLGYPWLATVEYWHLPAFISFGDGHGVWESSGGPLLPFHARNFRSVQQWLAPIGIERLMPLILELQQGGFHTAPPVAAEERRLAPVPDKTQSYGLNVTPALSGKSTGIVWAAVKPGETIPRAVPSSGDIRATVVQVTNLGLSIKDSPQNTVVLVTRLDDAAAVAGAKVSIRTVDNKVFWSGVTDERGLAIAPNTDLRMRRGARPEGSADEEDFEGGWQALEKLHFLVTAEKDGDVAYAASDWHDGISPWDFNVNFNLSEAEPLLRGSVFTDRGVYKLGEEVHAKVVLRSDTPNGMQLLAPGTRVQVVVHDSHDKEIDQRAVVINQWSSAEWTMRVPEDGMLGSYRIDASVQGQKLTTGGDFLVAAYRRPDFRVDATLGSASTLAGTKLDGTITGRYLFGGAMSSRPVKWTYARLPLTDVPKAISDRFPEEQFTFLGEDYEHRRQMETLSSKERKLDAKGELRLTLDTDVKMGQPWAYRLEGDVTDVSRQKIANRTTFRVDPAPWYIGLRQPPYFVEARKGFDTAVVAVALDGTLAAGVPVTLDLQRIQWTSVRKAAGHGFYNWESVRKELPAGHWTITSAAQPVPFHAALDAGGEYVLIATASDAEGRSTTTRTSFYAIGSGYTAWERYDHNRIDLAPEKKSYRPGETARVMVKSPWEHATALLTTEREGVRTWKTFPLTSTQTTVTVPITEKDIPNVFVSVLLVKGRTKDGIDDESDPGKPAFRLGYVELDVEDSSKRLKVAVQANHDEYRPATRARIDIDVHDAANAPVASEVTLWAVDYGVLSLTGYKTPDVLREIYLRKALQVVNDDSREKIVSRRVLTPKGAGEGGGGGNDSGPGVIRKDFRVLAFWVGSIVTDAKGHARTEITLPESLSTYRIMAVAADRSSRFGWAQNEIHISKPVLLTAAFPRFLAAGDQALFGAVVHSQLKQAGGATVTIKSLDPTVLEFVSAAASGQEGVTRPLPSAQSPMRSEVEVPAGGAPEVRFHALAKMPGIARVRMTVSLKGETDAFEDTLPVRVLTPAETVAAYGEANPSAKETVTIPAGVVSGVGGLHVELASTAMVGLSEGAQYLIEYPYGCAEQRASGAMALMLVSDLGQAFSLPGVDAKNAHKIAQTTIVELSKYQCGDGGFAFWPGDCRTESPYLTADVLHVLQRGGTLGYDVDSGLLERANAYLGEQLKTKRPANEGWWPAYTAWQAFAVKVLAEGGQNVDSHLTRLHGYADRMPVFGLAFLADAMEIRNEKSARLADLYRRIHNAVMPEGGSAHVEELSDPYLLYFWSSNVRSTAIVLDTLVRHDRDELLVKQMVRWMMNARRDGRWSNTQENVWAMESLVDYYRRYESVVPDFTATVSLGGTSVASDAFRGRSTAAKSHEVPMESLLEKKGAEQPVAFERQGSGTLFYLMRLRYVPAGVMHDALDRGISIERRYSVKEFKAGDLIKVTLKIRNSKERRFVAVTDPIPAGTEAVESWFATTASELADQQRKEETQGDWMSWWTGGGFDHIERHDDRVQLFATRLSEGAHEFTYQVRATTAGTFITAPAHAEEMYEPEVFGRTATAVVEVKP